MPDEITNQDISLGRADQRRSMNNNNNVNANGGDGDQNHEIPQHLLQHIPRPREVVFRLTRDQLELMYNTWAVARRHVRQLVYQPELPFPPYPLPPVWPDDLRAMMVLWVAREWRMFEMEMAEFEQILGLRGAAHRTDEGDSNGEAESGIEWLHTWDGIDS
ncbi:uncharacterized protein HD556DRAFT_1443034 [Suillus plorans]|uniref:Uncharacterized protein n=1 Tax=Suillus plorans TaxID=116603 RepID=A0A9P7ASF3_9AGAM|nr:uncharacterized protein HD556DRAFT_1443034 [Suillus plorans]KAG1794467.1 hypothetical protein HD556DRAFT_1443034 [Suillus plorans]